MGVFGGLLGGGSGDTGADARRASRASDVQAQLDNAMLREGSQNIANLFERGTRQGYVLGQRAGSLSAGTNYIDPDTGIEWMRPADGSNARPTGRRFVNGQMVNEGSVGSIEGANYNGKWQVPDGLVKLEMGQQQQIQPGFSGFNEDFYNKRAQAVTDYYNPQRTRQANEATKELIFALTRAGTLGSSADAQRRDELRRDNDEARLQIGQQAEQEAANARSAVEQARSGIMAQLQATKDPNAALSAASRQITALQTPSALAPLGDVFSGIATGIGAASQLRGQTGGGSTFASLFKNNERGSSRIVR